MTKSWCHYEISCFRLLAFVLAGIVIMLLLIPIELKPVKNFCAQNASSSMFVDQLLNYFSNVPSPNLNIADEDVAKVWCLPASTRLSAIMQDVGRCRIAAGLQMEVWTICNRINVPWTTIVLVIALANFVHFFIDKHEDFESTPKPTTKAELSRLYDRVMWSTMFGLVSWSTATISWICFMMSRDGLRGGFLYTPYGHVYPMPYNETPIIWNVVGVMCLVASVFKLFELFGNPIHFFKIYWPENLKSMKGETWSKWSRRCKKELYAPLAESRIENPSTKSPVVERETEFGNRIITKTPTKKKVVIRNVKCGRKKKIEEV